MRKIYSMLVIIFFGVLIFQEIHASEIKVKSFDIEKYEIVMFSNQIILKLSIVPSIDGNFQYFIHAPSQMKKASIQYKDSTYNSIHGNNINKEWMFNIPEDGYYFIETAVKVIPKIIEQQYSYFSVHTLYFEIKDRNIINFSNEIDTNFYKFKRLEMDSSTAIINNRTLKNDTKEELQRKVISVHISGNISFEDDRDDSFKGVPVRVMLDWDGLHNNSASTPYYWNGSDEYRHGGWDLADINGDFYFDFDFYSDLDANEIASKIIIYAYTFNEACDIWNGPSIIPTYVGTDEINISQSTTSISIEGINVETISAYGAAIRHLTRAWIFNKEKLGTTLGKVQYVYYNNQNHACLYDPDHGRIVFDGQFPSAMQTYHEYGHFSHDCADDDYPRSGDFCPSYHSFRWQTNDDCAFTEGWAEFFAAACIDYWYLIENATNIEITMGGSGQDCSSDNGNIYQFLDYGQTLLCPELNNIRVEGAIACFFYSLYDGYDQRFNNYSGDNEDLSFSGAFLRNHLDEGVAYARHHNYSLIDGFKRLIINNLDNYQINEKIASINAFYNSLFNNQGVQRPATPTQLEISGDYNSRYLIWNDNTCPDEMNIPQLGGGSALYTFFQNNETGFRIYRKPMGPTEEWDGTVNNFSLIQTTIEDIINISDNSVLSPGRYCYVVVAFNAGGNSIPKAHKIIECSQSATQSVIAVNEDMDNVLRNFAASNLIEVANINETNIFNNSNITFCSGQEIVFNPGATIESGSTVRAYINNCPGCSYSSDPPLFKSNKYENFSDLVKRSLDRITILPNPFTDITRISISLSSPDIITLTVYDVLGNRIAVLADMTEFSAGTHNFNFSGHNINSGVYYVVMSSSTERISRPLMLIK